MVCFLGLSKSAFLAVPSSRKSHARSILYAVLKNHVTQFSSVFGKLDTQDKQEAGFGHPKQWLNPCRTVLLGKKHLKWTSIASI
jgi:hypothetical protein